MAATWTKSVYIMACDLIAYTDMLPVDQTAAKAKIERWQTTSVPKGAKWIGWADAGDGGYLLLDGGPDCALEALKLFTAKNAAEGPLKFRYCLHHDMVTRQPGKGSPLFSGDGMNEAARILGGMDKDKVGQVVCSGAYAKLLEREVAGEHRLTRLPDIQGKREEVFEAWNLEVAEGVGLASAPAIKFEKRQDIEDWLETQPDNVNISFAARGALRNIPFLADAIEHESRTKFSSMLVSAFCGVSAACFAANWPDQVQKVSEMAEKFSIAIVGAKTTRPPTAQDALYSADFAAFATAFHRDRIAVTSNTATILYSSVLRHGKYAISSLRNDVLTVSTGTNSIMQISLWTNGEFPLHSKWKQIKSWMLADSIYWSVWIDWYEARLANSPADPVLELARIKCLEGANLKDAKEVNRRIQAVIDAHEPRAIDATPISREPKIEKTSGDIARRHQEEAPGRKTGQQLYTQYRIRLLSAVDRLTNGKANQEFHELHEGLSQFRTVIEAPYDADLWAEDWTDEFDNITAEIALKQETGYLPARSAELSQFTKALEKADFEIGEVYPHIEQMAQALRARRFRNLSEEELEAVEASLEAFSDIVDERLQRELGEDVEGIREDIAAIKADGNDPLYNIPDGAQKARLYRLKALFLRMRRLAKTSPDELTRILDKGVDVTKKIAQYEKAAETLDKYWEILRHWFIGGA